MYRVLPRHDFTPAAVEHQRTLTINNQQRFLRIKHAEQHHIHSAGMVACAAADAGLKTLRLLKLSKHMEALSRENMMDFLYTVGMVCIA
jgi:hypothetical protein